MNVRHFFNDAEAVVQGALRGIAHTNPTLRLDVDNKSLVDTQHDGEKCVSLISGGGAGHEPAFAGFVGRNMLTAAVSGFCFASPSIEQITNVVTQVGHQAGTLLIIMNYTGDVLHFHLAAEKAKIRGKDTAVLVVGDDVSVGRRKSGKVGRRGLAGTILVQKILGAAAAQGISLSDLCQLGERVLDGLGTVGAALDHVHVPGRKIDAIHTTGDQLELGMGIHNEPGCRVISPTPSTVDLVKEMLRQLTDSNDADRAYLGLDVSSPLVLLVNNLGGVSQLEFGAIVDVVVTELKKIHPNVVRVYAGTFMTSLDSKGFSISLLKVDHEMLSFLDVPVSVPGWSCPSYTAELWVRKDGGQQLQNGHAEDVDQVRSQSNAHFLKSCCTNVVNSEDRINHYDALVGDGDCGTTLARGARAIITSEGLWPGDGDGVVALNHLAELLEKNMDGTSGALYSIFFSALAAGLRSMSDSMVEVFDITPRMWVELARDAYETLEKATPARPGDRTLIDALAPFVESLIVGKGLDAAVASAVIGKDSTKGMPAAFGRAVYVPEENWSEVPDPGAEGVCSILQGLLLACSGQV